jgi:uncharacterized coiled-coil protein SlyX
MAAEVVGLAEKKLRIFAGMNDDISKRFERIEAHVAHLEHQVEQLNEVVTGQDKLIELLKKTDTTTVRRARNNGAGTHQGQQRPAAASLISASRLRAIFG